MYSYLHKRSYGFDFRAKIPKDLIPLFKGRRKFQISLKNLRSRESQTLSLILKQKLESLFSQIREGMKSLTIEEIKDILRIEVRKQIEHSKHVFHGTNKYNSLKAKESLKIISDREKKFHSTLSDDLKSYEKELDTKLESILQSLNIEIDKNSNNYKQLRMSFIDLYLMRYEWIRHLINEKRFTDVDENDFRREVDEKLKMNLFPELQEIISQQLEPLIQNKNPESKFYAAEPKLNKLESTPISECIIKHLEEKGGVSLRTNQYIQTSLSILIEDFGDIPIGKVDKEKSVKLKSHMMKIPKNRNKLPKYRDKDFHTLIEMDVEDRISTTTINEHLSYLSSFMDWCKRHGYSNDNPFLGLKLKKTKRPIDERDRFSDEELMKLFSKEYYIPNTEVLNGRYEFYWIPLIALFSGMRLGEICPLYLDNIKKVKTRWCFNLQEEEGRDDKGLKTISSRRILPIHDNLIEIGLIEFIEILKKKYPKREKMFEELPFVAGSYNKKPSRWWNERYLTKLGIKTKTKNFHSIRHTVIDHLKQKGIEVNLINELTGHSTGNIDVDRYGSGYDPSLIYRKCIKRISYKVGKKSIDFKSLKVDWKKII